MAVKQGQIDYRNSPTAWFCVLETARERGDYERAAKAQRELRRLGVEVLYHRNSRGQLIGGGNAN